MRIPKHLDSAVSKLEEYRPVIAKAVTANQKTGPVSITYVSQHSCPQDCPFRGAGCYAEGGPIGYLTRRLNASSVADPSYSDPVVLARIEASMIDGLPADRDLRLHGVGDCRTRKAARIVSAASRRYKARSVALAELGMIERPGEVWTYTHSWQNVPPSCWSGVSVLASVETVASAKKALASGFAFAIVVPEHSSHRAAKVDGVTVIPCPNQTSGVTCDECRLCMDAPKLRNRTAGIAFSAHGAQAGRIRTSLAVLSGL